MPADFLTELLFRGIFEIVVYGLGYVVGRVTIPIFSLGYYGVEPWDFSTHKRSKGRSARRVPRQISADATCGIGLATLLAIAVLAFLTWRAAGP
jgi:hypothetical protein